MTTTYGKTIAIDPGTGGRLWEFTPGSYRSLAGSAQITTATPIVDPSRAYVYASDPDGLVHKLAVATGREVRSGHWPVRVTLLPSREKLASPFNISGNKLIVVTDGYIGDAPPYQGHVVTIDRAKRPDPATSGTRSAPTAGGCSCRARARPATRRSGGATRR